MKRSLLLIPIVILLAIGSYFLLHRQGEQKHKEEIRQIHEREVQKAIEELNAAKLDRKKKAEERKKYLATQKAERRSLDAQLRSVMSQKSEAVAELDDIRRPHLFRSRARKEAELAEQYSRINRLEQQAASLNARIARCQLAIDSLSN